MTVGDLGGSRGPGRRTALDGLDGAEHTGGPLVDFDGHGQPDDRVVDIDGNGVADRVLCAEQTA